MAVAGTRGLNARKRAIWDLYDFTTGSGLEIGPLHDPVVPRPGADVAYLDVFDRAKLQAMYGGSAVVQLDLIPEIDYVLSDGDRVRSIPDTVGDTRFDWVMASHVVEHVPDLIGWLDQVATVTRDGGALVLAVPDRRYCFDLHRPGTSLGQVLQAHELGDTVPSVRAVFDHNRNITSVRPEAIWAGEPIDYGTRLFPLDEVLRNTARARSGEYIDSHVWLFTPGTFLEQLVELRTLGLSSWRVERFEPTRRGQHEFYAVLRRLPRGGWDEALVADEPSPGTMPDWYAESLAMVADQSASRQQLAESQEQVAGLQQRLRAREAELTRLRSRRAVRLSNQVARLRRRASRRLGKRG